MAVGAYPSSGTYDECGPTVQEHKLGIERVRKVPRPRKDPVFGSAGPLLDVWKSQR
jgi:uncharacterized protein YjlB